MFDDCRESRQCMNVKVTHDCTIQCADHSRQNYKLYFCTQRSLYLIGYSFLMSFSKNSKHISHGANWPDLPSRNSLVKQTNVDWLWRASVRVLLLYLYAIQENFNTSRAQHLIFSSEWHCRRNLNAALMENSNSRWRYQSEANGSEILTLYLLVLDSPWDLEMFGGSHISATKMVEVCFICTNSNKHNLSPFFNINPHVWVNAVFKLWLWNAKCKLLPSANNS